MMRPSILSGNALNPSPDARDSEQALHERKRKKNESSFVRIEAEEIRNKFEAAYGQCFEKFFVILLRNDRRINVEASEHSRSI